MKNTKLFLFLTLLTALIPLLSACQVMLPLAYAISEIAPSSESDGASLALAGADEARIDGGALPVDSVTQATISQATDFAVDVIAGESYILAAQGGFDLQMELRQEGTQMAIVDEQIEDKPEIILYSAETDGTLTLTVAPYERGAEALIAFAIVVEQSSDALSVEVTDGRIPFVTVESTEEMDPILLIGEDEIDEGFAGTETFLMAAYPTGTYQVTAKSYSGSDAPYTLAVAYIDSLFASALNLAEKLPNTLIPVDLETATPISLEDVGYTFTIPDNGSYIVMATGAEKDIRLEIYDSENRAVAEVDSAYSSETEFFILTDAAGSYTALTIPLLTGDGSGMLSVRALTVDANQPNSAAFTLTEDDPRPLIFTMSAIEEEPDTTLTIADTAGDVIAEIDDGYTSLEMFDTVNLPAGDYTATAGALEPETTLLGLIIPDESYARQNMLPETLQAVAVGDTLDASTADGGFTVAVMDEEPLLVLAKSDEADLVLTIYDKNNVLVESVDNRSAGIAEAFALVQAGTYTVVPSLFFGDEADFTITAVPMQMVDGTSTEVLLSAEMVTFIYAIPDPDAGNDVVLFLKDATGEPVESIDWSGAGIAESFISDDLETAPGTYTAEATNWSDGDDPITW